MESWHLKEDILEAKNKQTGEITEKAQMTPKGELCDMPRGY